MKSILYIICILCFVHLSFSPGITQAQNLTSEQDSTILNDEIEEITITAFRSPYNVFNTPAPVNLILGTQLEAGNALTPVDALNRIPGILMHHGTLNTNRLTIRGIGSRTPYGTNKIKAYFGDIPLTAGDGETTLEDLENLSIQRIEIIKGPSSSLYGAGLAGVILFHPKSVSKDFVQYNNTTASFGTSKNTLAAGLNDGKLNIFALGSVLNSNGYRDNNETDRGNIFLNSLYKFSDKTHLQSLIRVTKMKGHIPSSLDLETFNNSPQSAAANWAAIAGFEEYTKTQFGVSLNRFTQREGKISVGVFGSFRSLDELRPFNKLEESSDYLGWRAEMQKVVAVENAKFVLTTGFEMFRENFNWSTYNNDNHGLLSDNNEKRQYENLFVQLESSINNRVFISTGINGNLTRFNYTDQFLDNGDQSGKRNYKPVISPRLGINVLLREELSVFGNFSHGFSTPSFQETLLPEGEVNPEIKPETGWNFEIGFRSQFKNRLLLSASYYRIYIDNLLVARRTGEDAYVGVNAGQSVHPGVEAEFTWNAITLHGENLLILRGSATLADYHFTDFVDLNNNYSGKLLPGTAKQLLSVSAQLNPVKNISLHIWHQYTGKMAVNDANSDFSKAFGVAGLELKYQGNAGRLKLGIKGGIQNIFDEHYAAMLAVNAPSFNGVPPRYYYPGDPRNYYVTVLIGLLGKQH
ncbi:TonB-dependent receptor [Maribellus sp. YY47]|uniref:TonB-dependent receptor n=1 Tax=Maribellus sp. YY47 TaxID=2929486 RepID=UPI0020017013|nr:TonB-dependent receptor [Maribellus sp. YY47]MCK3683409.1 TonB-dependent receptor [Maribellus sp. YY47]